ncbi:probable cytochrome P450 4p2 [Vespa mandarinia]|uniref:probable cytochrome P450 4p2 n=1 Tax=Vespa mandarinia TaxID=7446 RepID=UPI001613D967|nr:probable cytochrome P450 4p2 [Vespa mandarinia]
MILQLLSLAFYASLITKKEIYEELNQIYGSSDPKYVPIIHDDIKNMNILNQVIKKMLRLFPIGPIIGPKATKVEENWTIPKRSSVIFWTYKIHWNQKYWNKSLKFDSDGFLSCNVHSYNFLRFGIGARNYIGNSIFFQIIEIKFQKVTQQHVFTIVFTFLGQMKVSNVSQ